MSDIKIKDAYNKLDSTLRLNNDNDINESLDVVKTFIEKTNKVYELTYIVDTSINDFVEMEDLSDVLTRVESIIRDEINRDSLLSDYYEKYIYEYIAKTATLDIDDCISLPFINDDGDFGSLIIKRVR